MTDLKRISQEGLTPRLTLASATNPRLLPIAALFWAALAWFASISVVSPGQDNTGMNGSETASESSAQPGQALAAGKSASDLIDSAQEALTNGQPDEALVLYQQAIAAEPENYVPRLRRAILLLNTGQSDLAYKELQQAIGACPPTAELHAFAGVTLVNLGRAEEAVAQLESALQLPGLTDQQKPQVLNMAGVAHLALIHWDEAQECFRKALKLNPNLVDAQANLAIYYRHRAQPDKVFDAYEKALKLDPTDIRSLQGRAEERLILQQYPGAKEDLDKAIASAEEQGEANDPSLFWNSALVEWRLGNDEATRRRADQTRQIDPQSPEAEALVGFLQSNTSREAPTPSREINRLLKDAQRAEQEDRYSSSVMFLTDADLRAPGDDRALHARGRAYAHLGELTRAADDLDRAILAYDRNADSAYWRGNVAFDLARYYEAIVHYRRALALRARYCEPWQGLGNALLQVRRYAEAIIAYDNFLQCGPASADVYNNRGVAHWNLNLLDQALDDFNKALQIDPTYWNALFNRGVLLGQMGDLEGACRDLTKVREVWPDDPDVARWIGEFGCDREKTPTPSPSASATDIPPTPRPSATPSLSPSPSPSPSASPSPSPSASPSPSPSPTASPSRTATPSPSRTPEPGKPTQAPAPPPTPIPTDPPIPTPEPPPPPMVIQTPAPSPTPAKPPVRTPIPPTPTPVPPMATPVPVTRLTIQTEPEGAFIAVDGRYVGASPIRIEVAQMVEHRITVLGEKRIVQEMTYLPARGEDSGSLRVKLGPVATFNDLRLDAPRLQKRLDAQSENPLLLVQMAEVALADNSYELGAQLAARAFSLASNFAYAEKALGIYQANIAFRELNAATSEAKKRDAQTIMDMAQAHLDNALAAFPTAPWALVAHATPAMLAGRYDQARKDFEAALKADPAYIPALNSLAGIEIQRGFRETKRDDAMARFNSARGYLDKALAAQPESVDALSRLALLAAVVDRDNAKAIDLAEKGMRIDPADPQPFIIRGNAYLALTRLDEARDDLIRALVLNPNDPDTRKTLEMILERERK